MKTTIKIIEDTNKYYSYSIYIYSPLFTTRIAEYDNDDMDERGKNGWAHKKLIKLIQHLLIILNNPVIQFRKETSKNFKKVDLNYLINY